MESPILIDIEKKSNGQALEYGQIRYVKKMYITTFSVHVNVCVHQNIRNITIASGTDKIIGFICNYQRRHSFQIVKPL